MSFDLYFCRESGPAPSNGEISNALAASPHITFDPGFENGIWGYENPSTGVYCNFMREPAAFENDDGESESFVPAGFVDANLSFNLNYIRPSFFGEEVMPIVASLCETLDLHVLDPQVDGELQALRPERLDAKALNQRWQKQNSMATNGVIALRDDHILRWSHARAAQWWRYQFSSDSIDQHFSQRRKDIFVPQLMLVTSKAEPKQIKTMIVWGDAVSFVFPPCDLVAVVRVTKSLLHGKREESGMLPAEFVRKELASLLKPVSTPIGELDAMDETHSRRAQRIIASWTLDVPLDSVERIASDSFVDDLP